MKGKSSYLLCFGLMGVSISLISSSIIKWGKISTLKEGSTIFFSFVCILIMHIIWYKYLRTDESLNGNKKQKSGILVSLWIGIIVGVTICSFLLSLPD